MARPDHRSDEAKAYRRLYKTARWLKLRQSVLDDEPLCRYCIEDEVVEEATVVDHIKPHRGDLDLFWDVTNLQSLCSTCHDGRKQREELGQTFVRFGLDGWPIE